MSNNNFWQKVVPVRFFKKQRTYFTLPAFTVNASNQVGILTCIGQFNYETTTTFSFKSLPECPEDFTGVLCVRYVIDGEVFRYVIWNPSSSLEMFSSIYNGETIKKHFTLEIWGVNPVDSDDPTITFSMGEEVQFLISILTNKTALRDSETAENTSASDLVNALGSTNSNGTDNSYTHVLAHSGTKYFGDDVIFPSGTYIISFTGALRQTGTGKYALDNWVLDIPEDLTATIDDGELGSPYLYDYEEAVAAPTYDNCNVDTDVPLPRAEVIITLNEQSRIGLIINDTPLYTYDQTTIIFNIGLHIALPLTFTVEQTGIDNE